jgi:hypothetical protein
METTTRRAARALGCGHEQDCVSFGMTTPLHGQRIREQVFSRMKLPSPIMELPPQVRQGRGTSVLPAKPRTGPFWMSCQIPVITPFLSEKLKELED